MARLVGSSPSRRRGGRRTRTREGGVRRRHRDEAGARNPREARGRVGEGGTGEGGSSPRRSDEVSRLGSRAFQTNDLLTTSPLVDPPLLAVSPTRARAPPPCPTPGLVGSSRRSWRAVAAAAAARRAPRPLENASSSGGTRRRASAVLPGARLLARPRRRPTPGGIPRDAPLRERVGAPPTPRGDRRLAPEGRHARGDDVVVVVIARRVVAERDVPPRGLPGGRPFARALVGERLRTPPRGRVRLVRDRPRDVVRAERSALVAAYAPPTPT